MSRKPFWELSRQGKHYRQKSIAKNGLGLFSLAEKNLDSIGLHTQPQDNQMPDSVICSNDNVSKDMDVGGDISNSFEEDVVFNYPSGLPNHCPVDNNNFQFSQPSTSDIPCYDDFLTDDSNEGEWFSKISESESVKESLKHWAIKFNISHLALTALLSILQPHSCFSNLPVDARTVLRTPREVSLISVKPGHYAHMGLEAGLKKIWNFVKENFSHVDFLINIDGLPLFKSSSNELWPILGLVTNVPSLKGFVFPIGIYCGEGKPSNCSEYLKCFVEEAKRLITEGILINGKSLTVSIKGFICDAPAKSFILNTKGHTGYSSCTKCNQRGAWLNNRMTFPLNNAASRTHEAFLRQEDEDFHSGNTPLVEIPGIDFVGSFPLDYMHLVCLGVVRTVMYLWAFGPVPLKFQSRLINSISSKLISLKHHMPIEFNRKPRSLDQLKRWKATEYRSFLLYTGPVVLKDILKGEFKSLYDHFLSLSISMSILLSPSHCTEVNVEYANTLLKYFVESTKTLYGEHYITHNVHGLIHLCDSIKTFGCLNESSAFPFENFLQLFKKIVRKGDKPLQQVIKRCEEIMSSDLFLQNKLTPDFNSPKFAKCHSNGPLLDSSDSSKQYSEIIFSTFTLTTTHPNACCFINDGSIVLVENIVFSSDIKEMVILCREFGEKIDFYGQPLISSSELNVFMVSNLSNQLVEKAVKNIIGKMVLLPHRDRQIAFPLLHSI